MLLFNVSNEICFVMDQVDNYFNVILASEEPAVIVIDLISLKRVTEPITLVISFFEKSPDGSVIYVIMFLFHVLMPIRPDELSNALVLLFLDMLWMNAKRDRTIKGSHIRS